MKQNEEKVDMVLPENRIKCNSCPIIIFVMKLMEKLCVYYYTYLNKYDCCAY